MKAVLFDGAGGNEVVRYTTIPDPAPGDDEILVSVKYAALNHSDLLQRQGLYPAPPGDPENIPGVEVAGVVERVGRSVAGLQPGQRVFGLVGGGGLAERVVVDHRLVTPVPDSLDDRGAAAVPGAFITAHDAIVRQGELRPGETLLVVGASGGVGTAAVQVGREAGARVVGVVRSSLGQTAMDDLRAEWIDVGVFPARVRDVTSGAGANVILELVGGSQLQNDLEAVARNGRIVTVAIGSEPEPKIPLLKLLPKQATIRGTVLRPRSREEKAAAVRAFERDVVPGLAGGRLRPIVHSVFDASEAPAAFDELGRSGKVGKVLVAF
jgi:NADPH:quinone reductase